MRKKAMGGRTEPAEPKAKADERTKEMVSEEEKGRKAGGKVMGSQSKPRPDRRARGGRMTPSSPFSGADGPNPSYARSSLPKPGTQGKGDTVRP